jgi:hypothetical protein
MVGEDFLVFARDDLGGSLPASEGLRELPSWLNMYLRQDAVEVGQSGEAAEHETNHAQMDECLGGFLLALIVLGQAPLAVEPPQGAFV